MPDTEGDDLEELREKVERLEDRNRDGESRVEMEAYDLKVKISSEDATVEELTELASGEIEMLTQRALIGEYQELEEQSLHGRLFGGE
ncbi:hypothetical protein [Halobacterium salinarum]|jgi:hypothetical protein|uniref:hypothetical protein n=1 Tax=Halobacterium salinarum TaxID=2242 RepID=UPI0025571615|nr:hypothetical protein [Halobacterium salinarum]MDL0144124.1 hypothetical protein [Halobacterium salinarum]